MEYTFYFCSDLLYLIPDCQMTFPAIINATESPIAAFISFIVAMMLAWMGASLFKVAVVACVVVFVIELLPFI